MKKIVICGPESSGKSTLTKQLANSFMCPYVIEYSRPFLNALGRQYVYDDLYELALKQISLEDNIILQKSSFLFCDTDLISIKIWSDYRFTKTDPRIIEMIENRHYDHYLLCKPDIAWEADPLRENPHDRDVLFDLHVHELSHFKKHFSIVEGVGPARLDSALQSLKKL